MLSLVNVYGHFELQILDLIINCIPFNLFENLIYIINLIFV